MKSSTLDCEHLTQHFFCQRPIALALSTPKLSQSHPSLDFLPQSLSTETCGQLRLTLGLGEEKTMWLRKRSAHS